MIHPKPCLVLALCALITFPALGQTYLEPLTRGDLDGVARQLGLAGTTFKKEPLAVAYLRAAGAKARAQVVKDLLDRGADPLLGRPLMVCLDPASENRTSPDFPEILRVLLERGAGSDLPAGTIGGVPALDYQLGRAGISAAGLAEARVASLLLNANLRLSPRKRVAVDPRFAGLAAVLTDDIDQVRKALGTGDPVPTQLAWALAAGSEKATDFLLALFGCPPDLGPALPYVTASPRILGLFLAQGLSPGLLYPPACQTGRVEAVRQIRSRDKDHLWVKAVPDALAGGGGCFQALAGDLSDLTTADSAALGAQFYGKPFLLKEVQRVAGAESVSRILAAVPPAGADQTARVARYGTKVITGFQFPFGGTAGPAPAGVLDPTARTITFRAPGGTDPRALVPRVDFTGASLDPPSGTARNFTGPVEYKVTAEDGTSQVYTVAVTVPKADKSVTAFRFASLQADGVISEADRTITVTVPAGTDVTALVPLVTVTGTQVVPGSGVPGDFTLPLSYRVTAEDGTVRVYTVTVKVLVPDAPPTVVPAP